MSQEEKLASFQAVTGASEQESRFFLDANGWDLTLATDAYLDSEEPVNNQGHRAGGGGHAPPVAAVHVPQAQSKPAPKQQQQRSAPARGGVASLRDYNTGEDDHDSDDEDGPQNYYAGGEKSGQMIQAPKDNKKKGADDVVNEVFDSAKKHGATSAETAKPAAPKWFGGEGHKLGDTATPSAVIKPAAVPQPQNTEVTRTITFWKNGFSVDNEALRSFDDPANKQFLDDINKGIVPQEMARGAQRDTRFSINLVDNRTQDYKEPPKPKMAAFSGSGHTLGSAPSAAAPAPTTTVTPAARAPSASFSVDEGAPTTSIQIRLADGTRLVSKFNHTHTVGDIRRFVDAARRGGPAFDLMTTFPQKLLSDDTQTIAVAGLQNAVIVQKTR